MTPETICPIARHQLKLKKDSFSIIPRAKLVDLILNEQNNLLPFPLSLAGLMWSLCVTLLFLASWAYNKHSNRKLQTSK